MQLADGEGQGKSGQRLSSGHAKAVEAGKLLLGLLPFLLFLASDGREQQVHIILPNELGFFPQAGELPQAAILPEPEERRIGIVLLPARGDHESGPRPTGGEFRTG